ncbi:hypothetical protein, unlikely [Trypanosoma brucei gambiense DAL972]|uniref:Uncharacterized protein n=1 Tax=Trypanosoma brucei gambiense (strain MHOM/CI/86/DAL972) TaxID=679716 RepID=C9ZSM5_TRYB9|nr:hypothetical protein, unlikely [Trypanosoma brucei gambiense DAL972]CBH12409.1 hypothetical protein, unlikely [Trypanosoma brucei gambiense DAL972]|eukprot:XP_011774690.1 hypothetical protein, unlikely [Trypanosoma brucei gambiense DAL972]
MDEVEKRKEVRRRRVPPSVLIRRGLAVALGVICAARCYCYYIFSPPPHTHTHSISTLAPFATLVVFYDKKSAGGGWGGVGGACDWREGGAVLTHNGVSYLYLCYGLVAASLGELLTLCVSTLPSALPFVHFFS